MINWQEFASTARGAALSKARAVTSEQYLVLDTETTGLGEDARIVEIAVLGSFGEVIFGTLINPEVPIPAEASRIHGITDEQVAGAPTWEQIYPGLAEWLNAARCVCIYNADYDLRLLQQMNAAYGLPDFSYNQVVCVMKLYADYAGEWDEYHGHSKWWKLGQAAQNMGFVLEGAHGARQDCLATLAILQEMGRRGTWLDYLGSSVDLEKDLAKLAAWQIKQAEAKTKIQTMRQAALDALEQSQEYKLWKARTLEAEQEVAELETIIRSDGLKAGQVLQNKQPVPGGVSIKVSQRPIYNIDKALEWASENLPQAIELNAKLFEQHARAVVKTAPLDFVAFKPEPTAQIASDLSKYRPAELPDWRTQTVDETTPTEIPF